MYYTTLHSPLLGSVQIKVTTLNPQNGRIIDQYSLKSDTSLSSRGSILHVGANSASPILAWTDKDLKNLHVNVLGSKYTASFKIEQFTDNEYVHADKVHKVSLHAPSQANALPHFLVHFETKYKHWGEVFHVDSKTSAVSKAYHLPKWEGRGAFSTSSSDANVYFTRITNREVTLVSSASHGVLSRWPVSSIYEQGFPLHSTSEVVARAESSYAVRQAVLLSTGEWTLVHNGKPTWNRLEFLSGAVSAAWAELDQPTDLVHELEVEGHSSIIGAYVHRVKRHVKDLKYLPEWLQKFPKKISQNFLGGPSDEPETDPFGFHKFVVIATENCRLVGLDHGNMGHALWNVNLDDAAVDGKCKNLKIEVAPEGFVVVEQNEDDPRMLFDVVSGERLQEADVKAAESERPVQEPSNSIFYKTVDNQLRGYFVGNEAAGPAWSYIRRTGERIVDAVSRSKDEPVASIGKVLGDRNVLYKYLNPNVVLVTVANDVQHSLSAHLIDGITGESLYSVTHEAVDTSRPLASLLSENWFSYSFTLGSSDELPSRGYQLVIAEMYESAVPNVRSQQASASNYSSLDPTVGVAMPYTVSQTYHIPEEISEMAVTQTKQGITSRQLLATLPMSNSIVGIPRLVLDPRRPIGRDPTATETAEGLIKYMPMLEFDPKWYLNHREEIFGIKGVISSPALLESTSLVFAYGLDLFGTRVSPSFSFDILGKGFNKLQMLATVAALAAGVLFVAPLVSSQQFLSQDEFWAQPSNRARLNTRRGRCLRMESPSSVPPAPADLELSGVVTQFLFRLQQFGC